MNKLKIKNLKLKIQGSRFNDNQSLIFNLKSSMNLQSSIFNLESLMNKGLTLIEVMIVVAILAILSSTLFSVFQGGLFSQRRGTSRALVYSEARAALDMMSREIEKAFVDERPESGVGARFLGNANQVNFIAPLNPDANIEGSPKDEYNQTELCEVGYWVDGGILKKGWSTRSAKFNFSFEKTPELIGNVSDLQFQYFDESKFKWDDYWDESSVYVGGTAGKPVAVLPRAIKISLTMQYEEEKDVRDTALFTTIVHIPGSGQ